MWVVGAVVSFVLILGGLNLYDRYETETQKTGGAGKREEQEKLQIQKWNQCADMKKKLAQLRSEHIVLIPLTQPHIDAKKLTAGIAICELEITEIKKVLRDYQLAKEASFWEKNVEPYWGAALMALVLMYSTPLMLKVISFYVLAPMASRRPPLVIDSGGNGREHSAFKPVQPSQISAVSQSVVLTPNQNLLIQADYLQTSPLHAKKSTKWLLNNKMPLSSLSSGMYMLNRVECSTSDPIVISSTNDQLSEIGIVELPEGAAFVCQPRSLVGMIFEKDRPIRVSKHWHFWSLQSWLTLQLRFLVFHGPGQLLIKGSRGIRMETASAPRLLNQNATLGFSANLKYANTRCETFVSYWAGKEALFHDLFSGTPGVYVYEEVPAAKPTGIASLPQRFVDAVLNAFGI